MTLENRKHLVALSKTISHALRHEPWLYELELDDQGWTDLRALLISLRSVSPQFGRVDERDVAEVIEVLEKKRFELLDGKIRALYGHSLPGVFRNTEGCPPKELFHGTSRSAAKRIAIEGLRPMGRQFVHLSIDKDTALQVGKRKARDPVVLAVDAQSARSSGVKFYQGNEHVWLTDLVPAPFVVASKSLSV